MIEKLTWLITDRSKGPAYGTMCNVSTVPLY